MKDKLKVVFLENYGVSLAERIFPASDLSEQISTAGREASGTGNMKFMLNGAVTIGTWDGANIEIAEEVGPENIFIFGHKAHEITALKDAGYKPEDYARRTPVLAEALRLVRQGFFSSGDPEAFIPLCDALLENDRFMVLADFADYISTQDKVSRAFMDRGAWTKKSILNTANSGRFSSDRTVSEYARDIWKVDVR